MGSSSSKQNAPDPSKSNDSAKSSSSSSAVVRRSGSCRSRVFQASCLRSQHSEINEPQVTLSMPRLKLVSAGESGKNVDRVSVIKSEAESECCLSDKELNEWAETNVPQTGSSFASRILNPTSLFLSRCGNLSFRLSRCSSLGSSTSNAVSDDGRMLNRSRGCDFFPARFSNRPPIVQQHEEDLPASNIQLTPLTTINLQDHHQRIRSGQNSLINRVDTQAECTLNLFSPQNNSNSNIEVEVEGTGQGHADNRNVQFSRTLSVGRLRDRVVRRSSVPDPFQPDGGVESGRRDLGPEENDSSSTHALSTISSSSQTSRGRQARYHDLLEHRSNFLERRRRIRSQVLDEIHQQSVVLSSRPSVSSIGSIPAPIQVVESLPLKQFIKVTEQVAQCYICLVEYEERDSVRTLPCQHEFHTPCIDKWLKEIHRVCPVCRRDICSRPNRLIIGVDASV